MDAPPLSAGGVNATVSAWLAVAIELMVGASGLDDAGVPGEAELAIPLWDAFLPRSFT
jgi:hypothetical protein